MVDVLKPQSFAELLEVIEKFQGGSDISWYRGCRNRRHTLIPSLYRHSKKSKIEEISVLEAEITARFCQRSLPFLQRSLTDDWDKIFLMQHYGVPTRLLDWSENPFVAIYFALVAATEPLATNAALWMCNPVAWNRAALENFSFKGGVLDQSDVLIRAYTPGAAIATIPMPPVMIYGSYNSPRIVAQRGGFALFGKGVDPMEKVHDASKLYAGSLQKIEIAHEKIEEIRISLLRKGFTESVIFPDLDGLAKELKRTFGFQG